MHAMATIAMMQLEPMGIARPAGKDGQLRRNPDQMTAIGGVSSELHAGVEAVPEKGRSCSPVCVDLQRQPRRLSQQDMADQCSRLSSEL